MSTSTMMTSAIVVSSQSRVGYVVVAFARLRGQALSGSLPAAADVIPERYAISAAVTSSRSIPPRSATGSGGAGGTAHAAQEAATSSVVRTGWRTSTTSVAGSPHRKALLALQQLGRRESDPKHATRGRAPSPHPVRVRPSTPRVAVVRLASAQHAGDEKSDASERQHDGTNATAHQDEHARRDERTESYRRRYGHRASVPRRSILHSSRHAGGGRIRMNVFVERRYIAWRATG